MSREHLNEEEYTEFLNKLDSFTPTIPDEVTDYFLQKSGVTFSDPRIKKVVGMAAQKFIADIASETKIVAQRRKETGKKSKDICFSSEDLIPVLKGHGVNIQKPLYYADSDSVALPTAGTKREAPTEGRIEDTTQLKKPKKKATTRRKPS